MRKPNGDLAAPINYMGGKSKAASLVWSLLGTVDNFCEPFCGSAAMLLARPDPAGVETINDFDCFVSNMWRALANDPDEVAYHASWPVIETDLHARQLWLVAHRDEIKIKMDDPDFYDAKVAGWWIWGMCNWIASGWCSGTGPWVWDGEKVVHKKDLGEAFGDTKGIPTHDQNGINRIIPNHAQQGINRIIPNKSVRGIRRVKPLTSLTGINRDEYIADWFNLLYNRLRDVRVTCGDWGRIVTPSYTTFHGLTGVFLDPPYEKGNMDYGAGGMGLGISTDVRRWCAENGDNDQLRIVLCGHAGEHDDLLKLGWKIYKWKAGAGYARTEEAVANYTSETVWASPHCQIKKQRQSLFDDEPETRTRRTLVK